MLTTKRVGLSGRFLTPKVQQTCQMHARLPLNSVWINLGMKHLGNSWKDWEKVM